MGLLEKAKTINEQKNYSDSNFDDQIMTDIDLSNDDIESLSNEDDAFSDDSEYSFSEEDDFFTSTDKINEINLNDEVEQYDKLKNNKLKSEKIDLNEFFGNSENDASTINNEDLPNDVELEDDEITAAGTEELVLNESDLVQIKPDDDEIDDKELPSQSFLDSIDLELNDISTDDLKLNGTDDENFDDSVTSFDSPDLTPDVDLQFDEIDLNGETENEAESVSVGVHEKEPGNIEIDLLKDLEDDIPQILTGSETKKNFDFNKSNLVSKDIVVLYEISKEISKCTCNEELFEVLLFIFMGQIGAAGASIIIPGKESGKWTLVASRGVQLKTKSITFKDSDKILKTFISANKVILVSEFSDDSACREEYLKFMSLDCHMICPVSFDGKVKFAVLLGENLSIGHYSGEDFVFIENICETSGIAAERISNLDNLREENSNLIKHEEILSHLDIYEERVRVSENESDIIKIINEEMNEFGVMSYAFFFRNELLDNFSIKYNEPEDFIGFAESNFVIDTNNAFTAYLQGINNFEEIENPVNSEILKNIFSTAHLTKINIFSAYPYVIDAALAGFVIIFRSDIEKFKQNQVQIKRFSKTLFMNYFSRQGIKIKSGKYVDNYSFEVKRIQNTISESASLDIPVGFAMFGIKNLRRYQQEFGEKMAIKLLNKISELISSKISKTDYMIRMSYNKFLLIMPGKPKKASVTFCNALKNEITGFSKTSDFQFLVTFIHAEYPEDGKNIYSILDVLD